MIRHSYDTARRGRRSLARLHCRRDAALVIAVREIVADHALPSARLCTGVTPGENIVDVSNDCGRLLQYRATRQTFANSSAPTPPTSTPLAAATFRGDERRARADSYINDTRVT